jgi:hypothetical protein
VDDDQIIDTAMAKALQFDAMRLHGLFAWAACYDDPAYPGRYIVQLATARSLPYVLVGDSLAEVQEKLPSGLERTERRSWHPPEVVEMWLPREPSKQSGRLYSLYALPR